LPRPRAPSSCEPDVLSPAETLEPNVQSEWSIVRPSWCKIADRPCPALSFNRAEWKRTIHAGKTQNMPAPTIGLAYVSLHMPAKNCASSDSVNNQYQVLVIPTPFCILGDLNKRRNLTPVPFQSVPNAHTQPSELVAEPVRTGRPPCTGSHCSPSGFRLMRRGTRPEEAMVRCAKWVSRWEAPPRWQKMVGIWPSPPASLPELEPPAIASFVLARHTYVLFPSFIAVQSGLLGGPSDMAEIVGIVPSPAASPPPPPFDGTHS